MAPKPKDISFEVFIADRCPAGYSWDTTGGDMTLFPVSDEKESYAPPQDLFLTLSDDPPTPESVLNLANQFGQLTVGRGGGRPTIQRQLDLRHGEQLGSWADTIRELRAAVLLYAGLLEHASGKLQPLEKLIGWATDGSLVVIPAPTFLDPEKAIELGKHFTRGDRVGPARYLLQQLVNRGLQDQYSQIGPLLVRGTGDHFSLRIVPLTLRGCAWLQLAKVINGGESYRQCRNCSKWILISREQAGKRPNRFTCSDACRMQIYLKRREEAVRQARLGRPVPEIARELDTTPDKVKGWLSAKGLVSSAGRHKTKRGRE